MLFISNHFLHIIVISDRCMDFSGFSIPLVVHFNWPRFLLLLGQSRSSNVSRQSCSPNSFRRTPAGEADTKNKWQSPDLNPRP